MNVEPGATVPDSLRTRVVELARALCPDAHLYGGHACLSCQAAAHQLVASSAQGEEAAAVRIGGGAGGVGPPPHGTSHKSSRSQWARLLSSLGAGAGRPAPMPTVPAGSRPEG